MSFEPAAPGFPGGLGAARIARGLGAWLFVARLGIHVRHPTAWNAGGNAQLAHRNALLPTYRHEVKRSDDQYHEEHQCKVDAPSSRGSCTRIEITKRPKSSRLRALNFLVARGGIRGRASLAMKPTVGRPNPRPPGYERGTGVGGSPMF